MSNPRLHEESIVVDGLYHSLLVDPPPAADGANTVELLKRGGVTALNVSVTLDIYPTLDLKAGLASFYEHLVLFDALPRDTLLVRTGDDVRRAKREGKLGVIFGTQGTSVLEGDIRWVSLLHALGLRIVQLTYNEHNAVGSGCLERVDDGLTRFGEQVIREMNRLGLLIDLSHAGERTSLEAIAESDDPVVFSHSGVKGLVDHPRNLSDQQLKAVAASGGVVGLCPHSIMCQRGDGRPTLDDYIDQLAYVGDLVGIEHVAVGTDRFMHQTLAYRLIRTAYERTVRGFFGQFDGDSKHVEGFNSLEEWPNLTRRLGERGFGDADVQAILGLNFLRVFDAVWGGDDRA